MNTIEERLRINMNAALHSDLSREVIGAAIAVHREIGPGKLESVYERAMAIELRARRMSFRTQVAIPSCIGASRSESFSPT